VREQLGGCLAASQGQLTTIAISIHPGFAEVRSTFNIRDNMLHFIHSEMEFRKTQWGTTTHGCTISPQRQVFAASMDITRSSAQGAGQGELHLATHGAGSTFLFKWH